MGKGRDTSLGSEVSQGVKKPRKERKRLPKGRSTRSQTDAVSSRREPRERLTGAERREISKVVRGSAKGIVRESGKFEKKAGDWTARQAQHLNFLRRVSEIMNTPLYERDGVLTDEPPERDALADLFRGKPLKMEGGFPERVGRGLLNLATVPHATVELGKASAEDIRSQFEDTARILRHPLRDHEPSESESVPMLKGIGQGLVETARHPLRDPVMTATSVVGVGALRRGRRQGPIEKAVTRRRPNKVVRTVPPEQVVGAARLGGAPKDRAQQLREAAEKTVDDLLEVQRKPAAEVVRESLGPARARAAAQKGLGREEKAQRINKAEEAAEAAGGGLAGERAALAELKGELPKVRFDHLRQGKLTEAELDDLVRTIQESELRPFEKRHAAKALDRAFFQGITPQPSQIKLLQTVFGQDLAASVVKASKLSRAGYFVLDVANMPRSMMSAVDASGLLRQNLAAGARHPVIWAKNFPGYFKAMFSEGRYQASNASLKDRPNYKLYEDSGLDLLDLGDDLMKRDEYFMSQAAEKIPLYGHVVRASGRGFNAFGNRMRADMFDEQVRLAKKAGRNVEDRTLLRGIANLANNATGRGTLGPLESWAPALNGIFWSPRLAASRINFFNPIWYLKQPRHVQIQAARTMVQLGAAAATVLGVAKMFGAEVGQDPRSADFAKIRLGDTRADILGGFQQYIRLGAQLGTGTVVSSSTGQPIELEGGFGGLSERDILERFGEAKLNPAVSFFNDMLKREDFEGHPFNLQDPGLHNPVLRRVLPLVAQDAYKMYGNTDSVPLAMLGFAVAALGVGTQTYGDNTAKKQKAKRAEDFKAWEKETEKQLGTQLNGTVLRAKQKQYEVLDEQQRLKHQYGEKKLTPKIRLEARINILVKSGDNVDEEMLRGLLTSADDAKAKEIISILERDFMWWERVLREVSVAKRG